MEAGGQQGYKDSGLRVDSPVTANNEMRRVTATNDLVAGFNAIGGSSIELRKLMSPTDVEAYDALMKDIMSALLALPAIRMRNPDNPATITIERPRPDRVPQLAADVKALERFFSRLQTNAAANASRKRIASAQKAAAKMLSALPIVLPTVSVSKD